MRVLQVCPQEVVTLWPAVEPLLQRAFSAEPWIVEEITLDQLKAMLVIGRQILVIAVDDDNTIVSACTVATSLYPNAVEAFITCIGGRMVTNDDCKRQFEHWARGMGYTRISARVRPSMARLAARQGYVDVGRLIELDLTGRDSHEQEQGRR